MNKKCVSCIYPCHPRFLNREDWCKAKNDHVFIEDQNDCHLFKARKEKG